jgi:hypothetical protein
MPYKDPEKRKAWDRERSRRRYIENPEAERERLFLYYQENIEKRRKVNAQAARKAGRKEKPKGAKAKPEVVVSTSKRYRYLNGLIYFTSKRGFTLAEVKEILKGYSP